MQAKVLSNILTLQALKVSKLLHELDFKLTDDAELHSNLIDEVGNLSDVLVAFLKSLGEEEERLFR